MSYVEQTEQQLKTKIKEHSANINKSSVALSVISSYRLETNQSFG